MSSESRFQIGGGPRFAWTAQSRLVGEKRIERIRYPDQNARPQ